MSRNFSDKTFTKILRGYSPDEVKEYIQYIDNEYKKLERVSADNVRKLALALRKLDEMNNYAEQLEKQLDEQTAQPENNAKAEIDYEELARLKNETIERAKREADAILSDAQRKSGEIVADAQAKGETIVTEAEELARSVRDKILAEAATKAESIIKEAQARTEETRRSAETMGAAALKMYGEVLSFRDTLFEAYNVHIESIEEIIETADELFGDEEVETAEATDDVSEEIETEVEIEIEIDDEDDELLGAVDISEYGEMLESLEEEAGELEIDMSEFREIIDELPLSEAASALEDDFVVVGGADETEAEPVTEETAGNEPVAEEADESEAVDVAAEAVEVVERPADEDEWISAEEWDAENSGEFEADYAAAAEEYAVETYFDGDDAAEYAEETDGDTYESYGEPAPEADEVDPVELEARKYSDVYPDDAEDEDFYPAAQSEDDLLYPDFENAEYAPAPEYSWGDDMYVEPADEEQYVEEYTDEYAAQYTDEYTEQYTDEYAGQYTEQYDEEYDEDYDEDFDEDIEFMEELPAAPVYDEEDELNRLKQFFSADFDESAVRPRAADTSSNSTTSIALSLNDFFEDGGDTGDFGYGDDDDMESLFEKRRDMSVTDEFDIVFGNSDSAKSVAEIRRQPIIAPEKPGKHKKHKKF